MREIQMRGRQGSELLDRERRQPMGTTATGIAAAGAAIALVLAIFGGRAASAQDK
jgi:hypothetical protein